MKKERAGLWLRQSQAFSVGINQKQTIRTQQVRMAKSRPRQKRKTQTGITGSVSSEMTLLEARQAEERQAEERQAKAMAGGGLLGIDEDVGAGMGSGATKGLF